MATFLLFWNVMFYEQLNSNTYFQYSILCLSYDHRKCSDFSMKLNWKIIVFREIFKYFIMPYISQHSGYVFTLWHKTRFLVIALDSKWNILSYSCFCSLFFLLIWMYLFWFWKYIQTSHKNTFDTNYFNCKQGLEQTNVLKERVFMMFICFGASNGFTFKKLAAFEVIRTNAKGNSNNVFGYDTALLKISAHYSIEMSIFVVCWNFRGFQFQ